MSQSDLVNMFTCSGCGSILTTYLIKSVKDQILVKQKCPNHLEKVLKIPLRLKDQYISHFRDTVFRCYKCGQEAMVDRVILSGPWTLIKLSCPTHGNKIPTHKIWSSIFHEISNEGSPIKSAEESERQIDSISQSALVNMFTCSGCGSILTTYLIKSVKDQILVKQKCPNHLEKVLRIPLRLKDQCISHFRDTVFRCYKCGQEAKVDRVILSEPWTLIKLSCPTHGNKIPTHKIWSSVYSDISNEGIATPQQVQPQPIPSEEKRFCRMCGERFKDTYQKFCQNCGSERYI